MTKQSRTSGHNDAIPFVPSQATLGYPNRFAKEPLVAQRRQKYLAFEQKLHAVFAPLLGDHYCLHEEFTVFTSKGVSGPVIRADCVAVTQFGVFIIYGVTQGGRLDPGADANKLRVVNESGTLKIASSPLHTIVPAMYFLEFLLAPLQCPIEIIVVVDNEATELGEGIPTSLLKISELQHFLRVRRERAHVRCGQFNVHELGDRLRAACRPIVGRGQSANRTEGAN
ncbi:hypothetical protein [Caballeronia humi]|uniref:hypothetical protein n=1 Tax=Caballeronia humi TaxID=326474 RepID=UPI000F73DFE4|nr:hypothetical protein [Caballeronia humi]